MIYVIERFEADKWNAISMHHNYNEANCVISLARSTYGLFPKDPPIVRLAVYSLDYVVK